MVQNCCLKEESYIFWLQIHINRVFNDYHVITHNHQNCKYFKILWISSEESSISRQLSVAYVVLISWHLIAARRKENRRRTPPTPNRRSISFTPSPFFLLFRTFLKLSDGLGSEAIGRCEARLRWHQEAPEVPLRHLCHQGRLQFEDLKSRQEF